MEKNKNIFSKILIIILMLLIIFLITVSFFKSSNSFALTSGIVFCLGILVVLCLSDTFDNFSIGKIISMSRNLKEVTKENERLKNENFNLINQMINIKNSNNQNVSINLEGSRNINDIKTEIEASEVNNNENKEEQVTIERTERRSRFEYMRCADIIAIKKVMEDLPEAADKKYEVKVTNNFSFEDDIMIKDIRFDAFSHYGKNDIFYEAKHLMPMLSYVFQLYYMLNLVKKYGEVNNSISKLILTIPIFDDKLKEIMHDQDRVVRRISLLENTFAPAIKNGLLEIRKIELTKEELDEELNKNK